VTGWNPRSLPSLAGKTYIVTGGSSGIGYFVVEQLAAAGASVVILARTKKRADAAIAQVHRLTPGADLRFIPFDLSSLESVAAAASQLTASKEGGPIDGLALNAGVIWPPKTRTLTADGLELMVGSNHVGHFALVARLFPLLSPTAHVVSMGSMSTRTKRADFADLMQEKGAYSSDKPYPYSKHAVQAFGFELARRLRARGSGIRSLVAHPGFSLDAQAPRRGEVNALRGRVRLAQNVFRPMTQGKDRGAWSMVRALVDPTVQNGDYVGPRGGLKGRPALKTAVAQDRDPANGAALWSDSERWSGVAFTV
jgi:NAD(P)-dependent dehydrogenase (short-subunit alcohol dehydrogenase family)